MRGIAGHHLRLQYEWSSHEAHVHYLCCMQRFVSYALTYKPGHLVKFSTLQSILGTVPCSLELTCHG